MMMTDDVFWQYAMLISNLLLAGGAALAIVRVQHELRASRRFLESPTAAAMMSDAYDDRSLRRMIDQRVATLQCNIDSLRATVPAVSEPAPAPRVVGSSVGFNNAARMARQGASVDDLVSGCGLNRGEAELLVRLHSRQQSAAAPLTH